MKPLNEYLKNLTLFYNATHIPFCMFDNTPKDLVRMPHIKELSISAHNLSQCCTALNSQDLTKHIPVLISFGSCHVALLKLQNDLNIMFGPICSIPMTYKTFQNINDPLGDPTDFLHLYQIVQRSPLMALSQFVDNICLYIKLEYQEEISREDMLSGRYHSLKSLSKNIGKSIVYKDSSIHNAISFQKRILHYIHHGNSAELKNYFKKSSFFEELSVLPTTNTELQKTFTVFATMCCIATLEFHLQPEIALAIYDSYLSRTLSIHSITDLSKLSQQISLSYCEKITENLSLQSKSKIVTKSLQYIQTNLYAPITINDLALYCHVSKRTITRHFTNFFSLSAAEYILQVKLEEAAFLLNNSTFSLSEISSLLSFSSQSHFSNAFKKKYRCTPQQYRSSIGISENVPNNGQDI